MNGREAFAADYGLDVSTLARFDAYAAALEEGQARMNLVSASTLTEVWTRHFADSAQLLALGKPGAKWLDLGAGAGFPGLVLALLGAEVDLVEATGKKARFLVETAELLGLDARIRVHHARAEAMPMFKADTITARALAPLTKLFDWGLGFAAQRTRWVLPKGARAAEELTKARAAFTFEHGLVPSRTSAEAAIVVATGVARKGTDAARDCQSEGRRR